MEYEDNKREVRLYIENAQEMLAAAKVNLDNDFYASSVNRSYYDINTRIEMETAEQLLEKARRFVNEVEQWLRRNQWL